MQKMAWRLRLYFRAEDRKKFGEPGGMRGPRRRCNQIAVGDRFGHSEIDVGAAGLSNIGAHRRISAALLPFQYTGSSENLRGVTDRGEGTIGRGKVATDFSDSRL